MIPIERLQKLPYNTRLKILWISFIVAAIGLVFLISSSIKNSIKNNSGDLIKLDKVSPLPETTTAFASVERVEQTDKNLKIYFNLNNTTNDILNVSKLSDIKLRVDDSSTAATELTDRQGKPFVQKILSQTQDFGILTFPKTEADEAELIFSGLFFESNTSNIFQQTLKLDLEKLNDATNVRK
jgi:hypothetical protein